MSGEYFGKILDNVLKVATIVGFLIVASINIGYYKQAIVNTQNRIDSLEKNYIVDVDKSNVRMRKIEIYLVLLLKNEGLQDEAERLYNLFVDPFGSDSLSVPKYIYTKP